MSKDKNLLKGDGAAARALVVYAVLGALALGALPSQAEWAAFAQAQATEAGVKAGVKRPGKVNMAPLRAFLTRSKTLKEQGKLDLSKRRSLTVEGDRAEDGTLSNVSVTGESSSEANFRRAANDFVSAMNESRALQFLEGVSRVRMTFTLDGERFLADTSAETPSPARAEEMARGYRMMVNIARLMSRGKEEAVVLGGMKFSSNGKQLLMTLDTPREAMGNLLLKQITPN
ncbi:MAG TPA: hypothetical protein VD968_12685 [Pyrinomonadaceae bacterium]|nr:hypothetical protein [Pyrinomonadaceae bacterium]